MIFGKRPPRAVRRHLEAEIAAEKSTSGDGTPDIQVIRTPRLKPFARTTASAATKSALSKPAPARPTPRAPKAAAKPKRAVAQPNPRGGRPESPQIPGHTLVVGRDIRLTGEISACHRLIVEGSVEADLTDTHTLEIADTGYFRGSATVGNCTVSGAFEGDLTVSGLLAVRAGGRVGGAIRYGEIEVERGGRITGRTDVHGADRPGANGQGTDGPGAGGPRAGGQGPQEVATPPDPASGPGLRFA